MDDKENNKEFYPDEYALNKTRIQSELNYARQLVHFFNEYSNELSLAEKIYETNIMKSEVVTSEFVKKLETILAPIGVLAKKQTVYMVAHAHIDMNWLWGFDETVAITTSTIETMLNLMDRYENFTFSQSQASIYKILAEYRPDLLERVKNHVKAGRWEVTASTWVEGDKNMATGDSLARSILYAKRYMRELFDLNIDDLAVGFEPDTFGHSLNIPEVMANAGVKYYYHCRGKEMPAIYNWRSQAGNNLLVYCEPHWYNSAINESDLEYVPDFCYRYGVDCALKVYGVGDHGGGATVQDIEKIVVMSQYPIFPRIRFGKYKDFFEQISKKNNNNSYTGELNPVFSGCYTSQSKIKQGNAESERKLSEAESLCALADMNGLVNYNHELINRAWEKVLFNQFHDILPGSGVEATRNFALANYQFVYAAAGSVISKALIALIANKNQSPFEMGASYGAGTGFQTASGVYVANTNQGKTRHFAIMNPLAVPLEKLVRLQIWDYQSDSKNIFVTDIEGKTISYTVYPNQNTYWGHNYFEVEVEIFTPAFGLSFIKVDQKPKTIKSFEYPPLFEKSDKSLVTDLENEFVKFSFDPLTLALIDIYDKRSEKSLLDHPIGNFRLVIEDGSNLMSSWKVGKHIDISELRNVRLESFESSPTKRELKYSAEFGTSTLKIVTTLPSASTLVHFDVEVDMRERGIYGKSVPKLEYAIQHNSDSKLKSLVPYGVIEREPNDIDLPSNESVFLPINESKGLILVAQGKHAFRNQKGNLSVSLLRSSFDPDPIPEIGRHHFKIALGICSNSNLSFINTSQTTLHQPLVLSIMPPENKIPFLGFSLDGAVIMTALKKCENENTYVLRLFEPEGHEAHVKIVMPRLIKNAYISNILEQNLESLSASNREVSFTVSAFSILTVKIELV